MSRGGLLMVAGGLSDPATIMSGGTMTVASGGTDLGAIVSAGGDGDRFRRWA